MGIIKDTLGFAGGIADKAFYVGLGAPIMAGIGLAVLKTKITGGHRKIDLESFQNDLIIAEKQEAINELRKRQQLDKLKKERSENAKRSGHLTRELHI